MLNTIFGQEIYINGFEFLASKAGTITIKVGIKIWIYKLELIIDAYLIKYNLTYI